MKYLFIITSLALLLTSCMNITEVTQESAPTESASIDGSPDSMIEVVGGNEESLREFISRWLTPIYPDETSQDTTVYIGSLPEDIPFDLPMPDATRIIGSVKENSANYTLILDTGLSPEATQDFYVQALIGKGWQKAPTGENQGGFVSQPASYSGYCNVDNDAFLNVGTSSMPNGNTNLQLGLYAGPESFMCQSNTANSGSSSTDLIPSLQAPDGVFVQGVSYGGGGVSSGGGDSYAEISADLQTKLPAAELANHYNEQLQTAGWNLQNKGDGEGVAWSTWAFKDEQGKNWSGTLIVIGATSGNDSRYALLRIEKNP